MRHGFFSALRRDGQAILPDLHSLIAYNNESLYGRFSGKLSTGLLAALAIVACTGAASSSENRHPVIGSISPNELTNRNILALPERDRQAWIHGAVSQMAQTLSASDPETAKCVMDWGIVVGEGQRQVMEAMALYPDERATVTVIAVARLSCANL